MGCDKNTIQRPKSKTWASFREQVAAAPCDVLAGSNGFFYLHAYGLRGTCRRIQVKASDEACVLGSQVSLTYLTSWGPVHLFGSLRTCGHSGMCPLGSRLSPRILCIALCGAFQICGLSSQCRVCRLLQRHFATQAGHKAGPASATSLAREVRRSSSIGVSYRDMIHCVGRLCRRSPFASTHSSAKGDSIPSCSFIPASSHFAVSYASLL